MTPLACDSEVRLGRLPILHSALPEVGSQPESSELIGPGGVISLASHQSRSLHEGGVEAQGLDELGVEGVAQRPAQQR